MTSPAGGDRDLRPPAVAGSFYPAVAEELEALLDELLAAPSPAVGPDQEIVGLLVPHAGLVYSGRVAAKGWRSLVGDPPAVVVVAGTNHFAPWLNGVALWPRGAWASPLGPVGVDEELAGRILALGDPFLDDRSAHRREHSIEVQLPFLRRLLPGVPFVPFVVSLPDPDAVAAGRRLGRELAAVRGAGRRVVLVASSDLAHYPTQDVARRVDAAILDAICALDPGEVSRREWQFRRSGEPGLSCGLCGLEPVLLTLAAVTEMGATEGRLLAAATSADVPLGDPDRVVGYGAVAFVRPR